MPRSLIMWWGEHYLKLLLCVCTSFILIRRTAAARLADEIIEHTSRCTGVPNIVLVESIVICLDSLMAAQRLRLALVVFSQRRQEGKAVSLHSYFVFNQASVQRFLPSYICVRMWEKFKILSLLNLWECWKGASSRSSDPCLDVLWVKPQTWIDVMTPCTTTCKSHDSHNYPAKWCEVEWML